MDDRNREPDAASGVSAPPSQASEAAGYNAHVPEKCRAGLAVANADKPLAALAGNAEPILARLRAGERASVIAEDLGVSHVALYGFLLRHAPEQWQEISAGKALSRLEQATEDLEGAPDQLVVSRSRELAKLAHWTLERTKRQIYGDNKQDQGGITVQVLIARDGQVQTNVIDAEAA